MRNYIENCPFGMKLENADRTVIEDNVVRNCSYGGFLEGIDMKIDRNTFQENHWGLIIDQISNGLIISELECSYNDIYGLSLKYISNAKIKWINCSNNGENGLVLNNGEKNEISDSYFFNNGIEGILVKFSDENSIINCQINGNENGIRFDNSRNNIVNNCIINGNSNWGIDGSKSAVNDARNNWWGDPSGPYHPDDNSEGTGDNITDKVSFDPWLQRAPPKNWYVDDDAPDGGDGSKEKLFNKIQDAINNATEGDTIWVFNGTYYENVVVNKTVGLIGNGSLETTIDGGGEGSVMHITANWVNISGFLMTNSGSHGSDSGINIKSNHTNVSNNNCSDNYNGIYFSNSRHSTIENNTSSNNGQAIYLEDSSNCSIENNTCSDNDYYAIYLDASNENIVSNNNCSGNPKGIHLYFSTNNILTHNNCSHYTYHGIRLDRSSMNDILNNNCSSNGDGSGSDRGIYLSSSNYNNITKNICSNDIGNHGNGIYLSGSHVNNIIHNICSRKSNGVFLSGSMRNNIINNTLRNNGRGIYLTRGIGDGSINNTAHFNNISGNSEYGVLITNNNGYTINATDNWWGHSTGPYHNVNNTAGKSDNVTDYVLFDPWLMESLNRPPTANAGDNQTVYTNEEVRFVGTGEDPDGTIETFEWDFDGDGTFDWLSSTTGETTHSYPLRGTYHAVLRVTDDMGATATDNCTIAVEEETVNEKPTITITEPANNTTVSGTVTIKGIASDVDSTIEKVEISIDDGDWKTAAGTTSWTFEWNTKDCEDVEYEIRARAYDSEEYSDVEVWNLIVDNVPDNSRPTITITSPANNTTVSGTVTFSGTASDPDGDETIEKVEISINSGEWETATGTTSWIFEWNTTTLENGEYSLKFRVFDDTDYSEIIELTLNVQKPPPENQPQTVTISSPKNGETVSGTITITGSATDPDGTVQKVEVSINRGEWQTAQGTGSWSFEWDTKEVKNGEYTIRVRCFDGTNYSDVKEITVTVENKEDDTEDDGGGGFIPGFGAVSISSGIGVALTLALKKRKKKE